MINFKQAANKSSRHSGFHNNRGSRHLTEGMPRPVEVRQRRKPVVAKTPKGVVYRPICCVLVLKDSGIRCEPRLAYQAYKPTQSTQGTYSHLT